MFHEKHIKSKFIAETIKYNKIRFKSLHYCELKDMFPNINDQIDNVIIMSDLHSVTSKAIELLISKNLMNSRSLVITLGDMGGNTYPDKTLGSNSDPFNDYLKINSTVPYFYFVQGNHDIYNKNVYDLKNKDGSDCYIDRKVINTPIGTIGGISGISVPSNNTDISLHKYDYEDYIKRLNLVLEQQPDIIITHKPVYDMISSEIKIPDSIKYFCGHRHDDKYIKILKNGISLNCDGRIFIFI